MNPHSLIEEIRTLVTGEHLWNCFASLIILFTGLFVANRARVMTARLTQLDVQQRLLLSKVSYYGLVVATAAAALSQLGVDIKVVVGAAGVLTVAVGFAAQTSTSNLISGLFLMVEKPFTVGDVISIGETRGEVMSIDLLSSKIRTFNNLMVRVPNETLVKSNIANYSYFPIRRLDFNFAVPYAADLDLVERVLRETARVNPLCLETPAPIFLLSGLVDSSFSVQFQVWTLSANMTHLQNQLYRDIKKQFDIHGVQLPPPFASWLSAPLSAPSFAPPLVSSSAPPAASRAPVGEPPPPLGVV